MAARRTITVDVVSDAICPWCWVGKRRFAAGLAAARSAALAAGHAPFDVAVRWRPFFLDPSLPAEGVDKRARYAAKFGAARVEQMLPHMARVGAAEGIAFSFGGLTGNTLDAHRLSEWAYAQGGALAQDALNEELFARYFEREQCPSDRRVLADAAAAVGLPRAAAVAFLESGALAAEVRSEAEAWRRRFAVSGVPCFVFDGGAAVVEGAQDARAFAAVLSELLAGGAGGGGGNAGGA